MIRGDFKGYRSMYGVSEMNTYISYLIGVSDIKLVGVQNFKPYSQAQNDAMLIFNYVNTCYKNKVTVPNNVFMTFGKTKVKFATGAQGQGYSIEFLP